MIVNARGATRTTYTMLLSSMIACPSSAGQEASLMGMGVLEGLALDEDEEEVLVVVVCVVDV